MRILLICLAAAILVAGCGPGRSAFHGRLVDADGRELHFGEKSYIQFHPVSETGASALIFGGGIEADGSFTIAGDEQKGIAAGRYTVSLKIRNLIAASDTTDYAHIVNRRYAPPNSPLSVDVDGSGKAQILKIDLHPLAP
jgi:hypothetical protein